MTLPLIRSDLQEFGNDVDYQPDHLMKMAIRYASRAFRLSEPQKMIHLNDLFFYDLNIWSKSPGLPWKGLGYKTKRDVRNDPLARNRIRWFWHRIKNGHRLGAPDSCAYVRSHVADKGEYKVRAVWGYPMTITMGEAVFAVPLLEAYQKATSPLAFGYETAVGGTRRIVTEASGLKWFAALDFKSFDKKVPAWLVRVAFDILAQNIDFVHYRDRGTADARRTAVFWDYLIDYFINTPIRLSNGERYKKSSGVASGSYFTQLIDSVVNYILVTWMYLRQHGSPPDYIRVLGDDSITGSRNRVDLDLAASDFELLGMKLNVTKSGVSRCLGRLTFLGYEINDGVPTKPLNKWLAALLYPEYPDRSWDHVASRALGLCYACFGANDEFDHICRVIVRLKPFDLRLEGGVFRMLELLGYDHFDKEPPDKMEFLGRLGIL